MVVVEPAQIADGKGVKLTDKPGPMVTTTVAEPTQPALNPVTV